MKVKENLFIDHGGGREPNGYDGPIEPLSDEEINEFLAAQKNLIDEVQTVTVGEDHEIRKIYTQESKTTLMSRIA